MAKVQDCNLEVSEFELKSRYNVYFQTNTLGKGMNPIPLLVMGYIVSMQLFYIDGFGIK